MKIHQNTYFSVHLKNDYYSIKFPTQQVVILPLVNRSHILFIKAIRPVFEKPVIELPAGAVDEGETLEKAALRELGEETGVNIDDSRRLKRLKSLNTIPSRTEQMLNIFMIDVTMEEYIKRKAHDNEVAGTLLLTNKQVVQKIQSGDIFVATTVAVCLRNIC